MRTARGLAVAVAALAFAGSVVLTVLREVDSASRFPASATAFASYALVGFVLAGVVAGLLFRGADRLAPTLAFVVAVSVVGTLVQVAWNAPLFVGTDVGGRRPQLTVLTANLQFGKGDATTLAKVARSSGAQVLVLEEVTFGEYPRLIAAGLRRAYPNVAGLPDYSAAGTIVMSRLPLTQERRIGVSNGGLQMRVGGPHPFTLVAVHPAQPWLASRQWYADLTTVRRVAASAVRQGPTLVAGDFNSTRDHPVFRRLLGVGLRDAAEQAGSGWQPTWPESFPVGGPTGQERGSWLRPLVAIDHVLVSRQLTAVRTSTYPVPGSDHRALVAGLRFTSN